MQEQNVKITVTAEDRASGPIKNVESALGGLEKGTSKAGGAMYSLGHAAEVAVGTMATAITTYGIAAVQNLNREMVKLSLEQSKFQSQTANLLKNDRYTVLLKAGREGDRPAFRTNIHGRHLNPEKLQQSHHCNKGL